MADIAQLESALVKADAAGDAEGARILAGEIRRMRQPNLATPIVKQNLPTMQDSLREVINDESSPQMAKFVSGVGGVVDNAAMRLKQLFGGKLNSQEAANVQANRDMSAVSGLPGMAGQVAGGLMMSGAPAAALYRGASAVGSAALPASVAPALAPTIAAGVTGGATAGLTNPVLPGESERANIGYGALGGMAGDAGARVLSRAVQPIVQSPAVQTLLKNDVVPTPGQSAGKDSFLGKAEQKAQSIFGIGDMISGSRNRAAAEMNRAALNQAVPAGQGAVQQIGKEGLAEVSAISDANYARLLKGRSVTPDENLAKAIIDAKQSPMLPLNESMQKRFDEIINKLFWQRVPFVNRSSQADIGSAVQAVGGSGIDTRRFGATVPEIPADKMKAEVIGDIGRAAQLYLKSPDAEQRALGDALKNARDSAQSWLLRSANVSAKDIAAADTAYAAQKSVEAASKAAKLKNGEFSPAQLLRAARPNSATERLAEAAQQVIPGTIPNSGTIDRAMLASLLLGGGAEASNHYLGTPQYLTGLALAPLAYSRAGSRYAIGDLMPGQQAVSSALRQSAPYAANSGGVLAEILRRQQSNQ